MNRFWRVVTALGTLAFAASFFLPPNFHNAPVAQFRVIREMILGDVSMGQRLAFIAVAITLSFAYVSAGISSLALLLGSRADAWGRWLALGLHVVGWVAITSLGITLIAIDDPWPAPGIRWYAAIAPWVLMIGLAVLTFVSKPDSRWPVVLLVVYGLQLPLQFILMAMVLRYHGASWGYLIGGIGATVAVIGSVLGLIRKRTIKRLYPVE